MEADGGPGVAGVDAGPLFEGGQLRRGLVMQVVQAP